MKKPRLLKVKIGDLLGYGEILTPSKIYIVLDIYKKKGIEDTTVAEIINLDYSNHNLAYRTDNFRRESTFWRKLS